MSLLLQLRSAWVQGAPSTPRRERSGRHLFAAICRTASCRYHVPSPCRIPGAASFSFIRSACLVGQPAQVLIHCLATSADLHSRQSSRRLSYSASPVHLVLLLVVHLYPPAACRGYQTRGERSSWCTTQCTLLCEACLASGWHSGSTTRSCQNQNLVQPRLAAPAWAVQPARTLDTPCKHLVPANTVTVPRGTRSAWTVPQRQPGPSVPSLCVLPVCPGPAACHSYEVI